MITPAKLGWTSEWTLRTDQIVEKDERIVRTYEFRTDLTPDNKTDPFQEIHTSLLAFPDSEMAAASYAARAINEEREMDISVDFHVPLYAWGPKPLIDDGASTMRIEFLCGNYQVTVKTKFITDVVIAAPILERSVWTILGEISNFGS